MSPYRRKHPTSTNAFAPHGRLAQLRPVPLDLLTRAMLDVWISLSNVGRFQRTGATIDRVRPRVAAIHMSPLRVRSAVFSARE